MLPDILSVIVQHVESTRALVCMRQTCRGMRSAIPIEVVLGMPAEKAKRLFLEPAAQRVATACRADGGALMDSGRTLWTWAKTTERTFRLDQHTVGEKTASFEISAASQYLWLQVADGGLVCTLCESGSSLVFSACEVTQDTGVLHTEIECSGPRLCNVHCWKDHAFLVILTDDGCLGLLQICRDSSWQWWEMDVHRTDRVPLVTCQTGSVVYLMPQCGAVLFALDLADPSPEPRVDLLLPVLAGAAETIRVGAVLLAHAGDALLELTASRQRVVARHADICTFDFVGPDAVFVALSSTYVVYNLRTRDRVFSRPFDQIPDFLAIDENALWCASEAGLTVQGL